MQYKGEYKKYREIMEEAILTFEEHLTTIRAGRANAAILNGVAVDYYGVKTPITQIGNITVPEARLLVIQPWDSSIIKEVVKALMASDIGITPSSDGKVIRLVFPSLTEERRRELQKVVKHHGEEAKVKVRNVRRDALEDYKKQQKESTITEDDFKTIEKDIQELTDNHIKMIDDVIKRKEEEILEV
ncbi:MAG: ribosome recycling factor [Clostridia bacterium]|nr:ribosome recycling factor [Clostridia bacterium]